MSNGDRTRPVLFLLGQLVALSAWAAAPPAEIQLLPAVLVKGEAQKLTPLTARMETLHVPGVSVAVIRKGKVEWARGFGVASVGGPAVTPDTLFQAASISKPVSAVAIMHLVESGQLDLDTDINQYLKRWKLPGNEFTQQAKVTLRGLLTHSAGVTVQGFAGYEAGSPLPTVVQILNGEPPANSSPIRVDMVPGKTWRYSGGGYTIAQLAVSDVTGVPYPKLMQDLVLHPFGMKNSTYEQPLPARLRAKVALPYQRDGKPVKGGPHVYPELAAAGLWTTATDLAQFAIGMQRALAGESKSVLSAQTARAMLVPAFNQQSIGFVTGGHTERKSFNHGGGNEGYRCFLIAYQDGDGLAIMTNSDSGDALLPEITRTIAHEYAWPDLAPPERTLKAIEPRSFDRYVGAYQFQNGRIFAFWRDGDQIRSRIQGQAPVDLFPTSQTEYFARVVDARLRFSEGAAVLLQNDIEQTVKRMDSDAGRAALDWSIATEKRAQAQTPAPGAEAALRTLIAGLASNAPRYDTMSPDFAQLTRQQLAGLNGAVAKFGPLETIAFKRVAPDGWDFYDVKFASGTREFGILMQEDGKIFGAQFSP